MSCYACKRDVPNEELVDMGKHYVCKKCVSSSGYEELEFDADEDLLNKMMLMAHEEQVTFNILVMKIITDYVENHKET